jgi:hypothetical protein
MTILQRLRAANIRARSSRLAAALAPLPLHEDAPETHTEAEYWRDVCLARTAGPLIRDHVARSMLADAALQHEAAGFCGRLYWFRDDSRLVINDFSEVVL